MGFFKYVNFQQQSGCEETLQQLLTSKDAYVRERTRQLLSNRADYSTLVRLALTLRTSPNNVSVVKLVELWPDFERIYRSGLPPLWNSFRAIYEKVVGLLPMANHVASLRGRGEGSITTLLALFVDKPAVYRALEEHAKISYIFIPFDPLRHAYDFLTVILPTTLMDDVLPNYNETLRGLRAIALLFDCDDAVCSEFAHLTVHPGYEGKTITNCDISTVLSAASNGYVKRDKMKKTVIVRNPQTISALIDVCRLTGFTGRDSAFFWFDLLCGFSVHPSLRKSTVCRWYGVSWAVIRELYDASSEKKLELTKDVPNEEIIWFDAREDARHLMGDDVWSSIQTNATRYSRGFLEVKNLEERQHKIDEHLISQWQEASAHTQKHVELQIVEYEPEQVDDYLLLSVKLPTSPNYLEALISNVGIYSCHRHTDSFTEETALTTLACIFDNPVENSTLVKFVRGLEDFLYAVTGFRYRGNSNFSMDRVYEVYKQYCIQNIDVLFSWAMRASAFYHLGEHQFVAVKKLPSKVSQASSKLEHALPNDVLQKAIEIYRYRLDIEEGSDKVALLKHLKYLEKIVIPHAYKYGHIHPIETSLALFLATMI